jgi:phage portal protein BeeE
MNHMQAAAALELWRSGRWDTLDIAQVFGVAESLIVKLLDVIRNAERGPELRVVS